MTLLVKIRFMVVKNGSSEIVLFQFGFKKWKSHVTARPLSERSDIVQDLYADISEAKPVVGTVMY
jgi:hypothetical protein